MTDKIIINSKMNIRALNTPKNWDVFQMPKQIKTASLNKSTPEEIGGFNLKAAVDKYPEHLFVKVFAIREDEVNDNGDLFSGSELEKAAHTFIGVPIFCNHQNDDIEKARGECVHSWYDKKQGGIYIIARVDKVAYPKLARGIEEGYINSTSMGCFTGDMRVLMNDGTYCPIKDVRSGNFVISHTGEPREVLNVQRHLDKENDIGFEIKAEGNPVAIKATKEHPFLILKEQNTCYITGDIIDVPKTSRRFFPRMKPGAYQTIAAQTAVKPDFEFYWKQASDLQKEDMVCFPISDRVIPHDDANIDSARLIGYFLAEGNYTKYKGNKKGIEFTFGISENSIANEVIERLNRKFEYTEKTAKVYYRKNRNNIVVKFNNESVAQWFFMYCGEYCDQKEIAGSVLYWNKNVQAEIIGAWLSGDGTRRRITNNKNQKVYDNLSGTTCSEKMSHQLRFILARLGIPSTLRSVKQDGKKEHHTISIGSAASQDLNEYVVAHKQVEGVYRKRPFRKADKYMVVPIKSIKKIELSEPVFNLEVDKDNSFIVEGVAVHNCSVDFSCCSICHNLAHTSQDYCEHVLHKKNRKLSWNKECQFHKSKTNPVESCPICKCEKGNPKKLSYSGQQVFEHNFGIKFIEDSFVVNPACHDCLVDSILHVPNLQHKVAELNSRLDKLSANILKSNDIEKVAGVQELEHLKDAMNKTEAVIKSMLKQKDYISLDYVSDLMDVMTKLQGSVDELTEMGYTQLPSPAGGDDFGSGSESMSSVMPQSPAQTPEFAPKNTVQSNPGETETEAMEGIGSVTRPKLSSLIIKNKKEFLQSSVNLREKARNFFKSASDLKQSTENRRYKVSSKILTDYANGDRRVVVETGEDGIHISEFNGEKLLKVQSLDAFEKSIQKLIQESPGDWVKSYVDRQVQTKEADAVATEKNKRASIGTTSDDDKSQGEVITEKQLADGSNVSLHGRWGETYESITESDQQLARGSDKVNDTTSKSPQTRQGTYDVITEGQLKDISSGYISRWGTYDVVTEKQWDDMSRLVSNNLPEDYTERITEAQIRDLLGSHRFVADYYDTITEDQLKNQDFGIKRWASSAYGPKELTKIAMRAIADAIAVYNQTPNDIISASRAINGTVSNQSKASFLAVINNLPHKKADRQKIADRIGYFRKTASTRQLSGETPGDVDALILAVADNGSFGCRAEDIFNTIKAIAENGNALHKAENLAHQKMQKAARPASRANDIQSAISGFGREEDGQYIVLATFDDIKTSPKNKNAFVKATSKFAQGWVRKNVDEDLKTELLRIRVDSKKGIVEATMKDTDKLTAKEISQVKKSAQVLDTMKTEAPRSKTAPQGNKQAPIPVEDDDADSFLWDIEPELEKNPGRFASRQDKRDRLVKEAQMMGGQMGGDPSAGGGAGQGATLPAPPGGMDQQMPVENFDQGAPDGGMGDEGEDVEASPPGTHCPACGVDDVDIVDGNGTCNNCGAKFDVKVLITVTKWPGTLDNNADDGEGEDEGEGDLGLPEAEGEGFEVPAAGAAAGGAPPMGGTPEMAAASTKNDRAVKTASRLKVAGYALKTRLTPEIINKLAEQKIELGTVSPLTGSTNTTKIAAGKYICLDTGTRYDVKYAVDKLNPKRIDAQWEWSPKPVIDCPSCSRVKQIFTQAMATYGVSDKKFEAMDMPTKGKTILAMHAKGLFKQIKTAAKSGSIIKDFQKSAQFGSNFPVESCMERISRRYGVDALALSGPCEGKRLASCVCAALKKANAYSNGLAMKLAHSWSEADGCVDCVEEYVRRYGFGLKQSQTICNSMKMKYASPEEMFSDELDNFAGGNLEVEVVGPEEDMGQHEVDPFDSDMGEDGEMGGEMGGGADISVTLSPEQIDALRAIDEQIDQQMGENPEEEAHHTEPLPEEDVTVDLDAGDAAELNDGMDEVLDESVPGEEMDGDFGGEENGLEEKVEDVVEDAGDVVEEVAEDVDISGEEGEFGEESEDDDLVPEGDEYKEGEDEEDDGNPFARKHKKMQPMKPMDAGGDMGGGNEGGFTESEARVMNSKLSASGTFQTLDFGPLVKALGLGKKANDSEVKHKNVQDVVENYTGGDDAGTIGHEDPPAVTKGFDGDGRGPRSNATIGHEDSDLNPKDKPQPKVPSQDGKGSAIDHETDNPELTGGDTDITGGEGSQGSGIPATASGQKTTKTAIDIMVEAVLKARQKKEADNKKLAPKKPVADDEDIKPHSDGKTIGHEDKFDAEEPENTESKSGSPQGHESDAIGDTPKSPKDHPEIPANDQRIGHEKDDEERRPEKQERDKGTVIARGDGKSEIRREAEVVKEAEAIRVAGRMLEVGLIDVSSLAKKISELRKYESAQIKDYEKMIFATVQKGKKGLTSVSEGVGTPLVAVADKNSNQKDSGTALKEKLMSVLSLSRKNTQAESLEDFETRKAFNRL